MIWSSVRMDFAGTLPVRDRIRVPLPRACHRAAVRAVLPTVGRAILPASDPPTGERPHLPGLHSAHGRCDLGLGVRTQVREDGRGAGVPHPRGVAVLPVPRVPAG